MELLYTHCLVLGSGKYGSAHTKLLQKNPQKSAKIRNFSQLLILTILVKKL
jgi:hypothetical protein